MKMLLSEPTSQTPAMAESRHMGTIRMIAPGSDQLLDLSRLHNDEVYNRSVDVQIMRLRRKIEQDPRQPRYIVTERRAGYMFGVAVETVY